MSLDSKNSWNNTLDIMLDVETLGNNNSPVIVQLSAVCFKIEDGKPLDLFNEFINPKSASQVGLLCDGSTMDFWLKQDDSVIQNVLVEAMTNGSEIQEVLSQFSSWVAEMMKKYNCKKVKVYGNGPAADCVWVRSAYSACKMEAPWKYWDDADVRTYVDIGIRAFNFNPKKDLVFEGEKHNAIDDCNHQIKIVSSIFKKIKSK